MRRGLLIDPPLAVELAKGLVVRGEHQALPRPEREEAAPHERLGEEAERAVLQRTIEVDEHVPARHQLHLREDVVGREAVIGEDHVLAQAAVERHLAVGGGVVVGERRGPARLLVGMAHGRRAIDGVDARLGGAERGVVDVGRVEDGAVEEPFLGEEDRERVDLLAGRAPGDPDLERGIRREHRHDGTPERAIEGRVAEELAHADREIRQELHDRVVVVQDPVLQHRDRRTIERGERLLDAPPQRRAGVAPKIVLPTGVDRLQQEIDLEIGPALGRHAALGNQTRQSDRRRSTSIGFGT